MAATESSRRNRVGRSEVNPSYDDRSDALYNSIVGCNPKCISFDIFDTLVARETTSPSAVFTCVECRALRDGYKVEGFASRRSKAEKKARRLAVADEVALDEIYSCLREQYDNLTLGFLKRAEIEAELDFVYPIDWVVAVFDRLVEEGRKVILISDMYLDRSVIVAILRKCNIVGYSDIYLSSSYGLTKASGAMFDKVLQDLGIDGCDLCHCGDSRLSDYTAPRSKGINATPILEFAGDSSKDRWKAKGFFAHSPLSPYSAILKNQQSSLDDIPIDDEAFRLGFCYLGPLLYSFSKWLHQKRNEQAIDKLYFLSRDGYIMRKSYQLLYPQEETVYLYASRRSYEVPSLCFADSLTGVLSSIRLPRRFSAKEFALRVGLTASAANEVANRLWGSDDRTFDREGLLNNEAFLEFWKTIEPEVRVESAIELSALHHYIAESFRGVKKAGIVDIGWHGSMQKAITKIATEENIACQIEGFYTGLYSQGSWDDELPMWGFLFSKTKNRSSSNRHIIYNSFFELLFTAPHGSVERFRISDEGQVIIDFLDYELDDAVSENAFLRIQEGALCFVRAAKSSNYERYFPIDENVSLTLMEQLGLNPDRRTSDLLGDFATYNVVESSLAACASLKEYAKNPIQYLRDLKNSLWRPAFLRRTLRLPLNYGEIIYRIGLMLRRYE